MFCYQCEQTFKGQGCSVSGVCGKLPDVASLQDLLIYAAKGVSVYAHSLRKKGIKERELDLFVIEALFSTVTNVNFDANKIIELIKKGYLLKAKAKKLYNEANISNESLKEPAMWVPAENTDGLLKQADEYGIKKRIEKFGEEIGGLCDLVLFGLKGMAAYADHAQILGVEDDSIYAFFHETLDFLSGDAFTPDALLEKSLKCGEVNIKIMEMLDAANTGAYGHPTPTAVKITAISGKCILVSGHDLKDLEEILKQTENKGINIYTHGEMLPANAYPGLNKYKHLIGNYGSAWQNQQDEFENFPGAILMTTNCIQKPRNSYINRIFTTGLVAWPDVIHIKDRNFTPVIELALKENGFTGDESEKTIMIGFARNTVMSVAGTVIDAVKEGQIKHFFLIGGCDGAKPGRNYYTDFAKQVPDDCVILTLACGKYRFNKLNFGDIGGIPRLLDIGQCNDAYSAVQIALALANAFKTDVNSLPLSFILSWYEQKAVCILLSLLYLGIKNMRLGPSLPAFIKPAVYEILKEKFNLIPITTPEEDLKNILQPAGIA